MQPRQPIQAAIDAAPSGSTIEMAPGTHQEHLLIAKDGIALEGAGQGRTLLTPHAQATPGCRVISLPRADWGRFEIKVDVTL